MVDRVPEELWTEVPNTVQKAVIKTIPKKKKLSLLKYMTWLTSPFTQKVMCPGGSDGKASACNARDPGSIPGSGRSPGEGNGNPLQYFWLENPMDGGAW